MEREVYFGAKKSLKSVHNFSIIGIFCQFFENLMYVTVYTVLRNESWKHQYYSNVKKKNSFNFFKWTTFLAALPFSLLVSECCLLSLFNVEMEVNTEQIVSI